MDPNAAGPQDSRGSPRHSLDAEVGIRRAGSPRYRVRIFDASPEGCKIEFVERPAIGERVWVKFEGLEGIAATVRWVEGYSGGVRFDRALHEAVFKRLMANGKA